MTTPDVLDGAEIESDRPFIQSFSMAVGTVLFCMALELVGCVVFRWQSSGMRFWGMVSMIALERTYRRRARTVRPLVDEARGHGGEVGK